MADVFKNFRNKKQTIKTGRGLSVSSIKWLQRHINDPYVNLAKQHNYRSRSAFKLIQIDDKFNLLKLAKVVVDLGCAPGGWLQVAKERCRPDTTIIGVDLQEVEAIPDICIIQGDFYEEATITKLNNLINDKVDLVLTDMAAPAFGLHEVDHLRNLALVEAAVDFIFQYLREGGNFVAKILRGGQEAELIKELRRSFLKVVQYKPSASYSKSSEVFIICLKYKLTA